MVESQKDSETTTLAQKRADVLGLCLAVVLALNCGSYFVRSEGGNLEGLRQEAHEAIGFPFLVVAAGEPWECQFQLGGLLGNLLVAIGFSLAVVWAGAPRMPFPIRDHAWTEQYSLKALLATVACVALILGISRLGLFIQFTIRDGLRFWGPIVLGAIWLKRRTLPWAWLGICGTGLFLLVVLVSFSPDSVSFSSTTMTSTILMRSFVLVAGIPCVFVLVSAFFRLLRHMDETRPSALETTQEGPANDKDAPIAQTSNRDPEPVDEKNS